MSKVVCTFRGVDEIDNGLEKLDETKVQLLFSKFPVGTGTFKRNKFIYVQYTGPKCSIVKRGQGINVINSFATSHLNGVPGFSTTDKQSLSFESLIQQMKHVFIRDNGVFSMEQIRSEYKNRLLEDKKMMHRENKQAALAAKAKEAAKASKKPQVTKVQRPISPRPPQPLSMLNGTGSNPQEWSAAAKRIVESLRSDNGPVNWAVFAADPSTPHVLSYGHCGIFELVKNLPEDQWLFGLFRISFMIKGERQRRMIFFQWIGSQLKPVRSSSTSGVYPGMAKLLSPYSYEIYLVGKADLNAQKIIDKSKNAFRETRKGGSSGDMPVIEFTEASYKATLEQEQDEMKEVVVVEQHGRTAKQKMSSVVLDGGLEQSLASMSVAGVTTAGNFDIDETIELVQAEQGGLVWAIFQVAD